MSWGRIMDVVCETCGISFTVDLDTIEKRQKSVKCENCNEDISLRGLARKPAKPTLVGALAAAEKAQGASEEDDPSDREKAQPPRKLEVVKGLDEVDSVVIELEGGKPPKKPPTTWHVFLDGDWRGPYDADEIAGLVEKGRLDHESKCWRDGLDDWSNLMDFEELSSAIKTKSPKRRLAMPPPPSKDDKRKKEPREEVDEKPPSPEERERQRALAYKSGPDVAKRASKAARKRDSDGDADLFEPYDEEVDGAPPSTRTSSSPMPARNSNSVLFDRYRLEAFSEGKGSYPPYTEELDDEDRQDSGLIDIKTLAAEVDRAPKESVVDELVNVGGGGFGALTLGHDETTEAKQPRDRLSIAVLFMGFVILVAIGVQLYLAFRDDTSEDEQPMMVIMLPPDPNGEVETLIVRPGVGTQRVKGRPDQLLAGAIPSETEFESIEIEDPDPEFVPEPTVEDDVSGDEEDLEDILGSEAVVEAELEGEVSNPSQNEQRYGESATKVGPRPSTKLRGPTSTKKQATNSGNGEPEKMFGSNEKRESWQPNESSKQTQPSGDPALPDALTKIQVQAGMNTVANNVRRCAAGRTGTVMIHARISGDTGRITRALVVGTFAGSAEGSCAARAARRARFPRFRQESLSIQYPFQVF